MNDYDVDALAAGFARAPATANGKRAGPVTGCESWIDKRKKLYARRMELYDPQIMQPPLRAQSLYEEQIMTEPETKQEPANDSTPEEKPETHIKTPPDAPGLAPLVEEDEQATAEIEVKPAGIFTALERTFQYKTLIADHYDSAAKLEAMLNELGRKGYQHVASLKDDNWLVFQRPHFGLNGGGDVAGQKAAEVDKKVKQADNALGKMLAGTG